LADDEAEIGDAIFNQREAAVTAGEEKQLHEVAQRFSLGRFQAPVHFEGDEVALCGGGAGESAKVVFAGGEEDVAGGELLAVAELGLPEIAILGEAVDEDAAMDCASGLLGACQHSLVEGEAGEREGGERERRLDDASL
jgi:hypothetical protein